MGGASCYGVLVYYPHPQAYLEFFASREFTVALYETLAGYPMVNYHIVNRNVSLFFPLVHIFIVWLVA